MNANWQLDAHDRMRNAATVDDLWTTACRLFRESGVDHVTAGTAPRTRLDAVTVMTSLPKTVMADYISNKLFVDDPWIAHSAVSNARDDLDLEQGSNTQLSQRCRKLHSIFLDHRLRQVSLIPAYGGARPGAHVLYAFGKSEAESLRDPINLRSLSLLSAIVAAHWRPEQEVADPLNRKDGTYLMQPVLAPREREVLLWLAKGLLTGQIAHRIGIKPVTVAKHLRSARLKLGTRTREHALAVAIRDGLIDP